MAEKPWEKYQGARQTAEKPWEKHQKTPAKDNILSAPLRALDEIASQPVAFDPVAAANGQAQLTGDDLARMPATPGPSAPGYADPIGNALGVGASMLQGFTANYGDEIAGGLGGALNYAGTLGDEGSFGRGYEGVAGALRDTHQGYAERNPAGAAVAETLGGLVPGAGALNIAARGATLPRRLAAASALGAGYGGLAGFGAGEGGLDNRLENAAYGAVVGAALGPLAEAGATGFQRYMTRNAPRPGSDAMAMAEGLPAPITLTRGQATNDARQLGVEYGLERGAHGERGANIMRRFREDQDARLAQNADLLQARIAGDTPVLRDQGAGAAQAQDRLVTMRDAETVRRNELYDEARNVGAGVTLDERVAHGTAQRMADALKANHDPAAIGPVVNQVNSLAEMAANGPVSINEIFNVRKRLSSARENGGEVAVAAGGAIRELDQAIDDALRLSNLGGDEAGVDAWRRAISNNREYADRWKRRDLIGELSRRDPRRGFELAVAPNEAVNKIFNVSDLGLITKKNLARDMVRMRDLVGAESPEWHALRQEAFMRVAGRSLGAQGPEGRAFSGAKLANAWAEFGRKNPELRGTIFTPEEIRDIGNWVDVARRVTTKDGRVYNPSGTAYALARWARSGAERIPVIGPYLSSLGGFNIAADIGGARIAREATSGRLPLPPQPRQPIGPDPVSALAGAGRGLSVLLGR